MVVVHGQVGSYRLQSRVARGRSGEVFRALADDGSSVALKLHDRSEEARREADRLAGCDHPAVVRTIDHGRAPDGRLWLAMPWVEGRTLSGLLAEESPLAAGRAVALVAQLAVAIDALHESGVVHGDLSPNNVLVDRDDRLTVIDLGAGGSGDSFAEVGQTTGVEVATTPRYASPEVARGERGGPAGDRYAVGLIAYEALTGAFPFPEVATPIAMLAHHAATEPVAPSEHRPSLSGGVDAVFARALAKEAPDRPASAVAVVEDLSRALTAGPGPVSRARFAGRLRSSPLVFGVAVLVLLSAVLAVAFVIRPNSSSPTTSPTVTTSPTAVPSSDQGVTAPVAGDARGLSCNLIQDPGFEDGPVVNDFYGGDPTNTFSVAEGLGVDGTAALRVGADDRFGLHADIVPVGPHDRFVFSAWVRHDGDPNLTAIYVDYLDKDFVQLTAARDTLSPGTLVPSESGSDDTEDRYVRVETVSEVVPGAAYAVPTLFKSGSQGSLLVDEVVFGPLETCPDLAS